MLAPIGGLESIVEGGAAAAARARGAVRRAADALLGLPAGPRGRPPRRRDTLRVVPALRARRRRLGGRLRAPREGQRLSRSFCLTVDVATYSRRERDLVGRFVKPWRATAPEGAAFQSGLSWDQVKRFKDKHDLPLIIKGIATVEDAEIAVQHGVEVVYVSNHGGRQLDHGLGSTAVLPEIVKAVAGQSRSLGRRRLHARHATS